MSNLQQILDSRENEIDAEMIRMVEESGEIASADDNAVYARCEDEKKFIKSLKSAPMGRQNMPGQIGGGIPATVKRNRLSCWKTADGHDDERKGLRWGKFLQAGILGNVQAMEWLRVNGLTYGATGMLEGSNSKGGYLVPGEFYPDLIRLVEERGVFRREGRVIQTGQDKIDIPRRAGGVTSYFVGESSAITASDMSIDLVSLSLKKIASIVPISNELSNDALIPIADMLATDMAYSIADKEDSCGFNGDGQSTYGGIVGVRQQLIEKALSGAAGGSVPAGSGLVRYGTGSSYANIAIGHLTSLVGKLPTYAEANAKWYCSKTVWGYLFDMICDFTGNSLSTLISAPGVKEKYLLSYPVVITDVMPKSSDTNQVCVLLGDLKLAAMMAESNQGLKIATSDSAVVGSTSMFETDQTAIRCVERFDINVHDVGSSTSCGPICGIISHTA